VYRPHLSVNDLLDGTEITPVESNIIKAGAASQMSVAEAAGNVKVDVQDHGFTFTVVEDCIIG
jgi:hypothetical protein